METHTVTSGLLVFKGRILILKRPPMEKFGPNKWDVPGGHFEEFESAEQCMIREAKEEAGLDVKIIKSGKPYEINDKHGKWIVFPFLLESKSDKVIVRKGEHTEFKWVNPGDAKNYDVVPDLTEDLKIFREFL